VVYHRVLFWDHSFLYFTSMIFPTRYTQLNFYYLRTTLAFIIPIMILTYSGECINTDKTNYVIFKSLQKKITSDISLAFKGILLARKQQVKFLGIYLDKNLSWKSHINHVCKKISKSIGINLRARLHLSSETKLLYYTLIYPYLNYCNIVWSSTYISHLNRIFLLQK
jgi:hypothetical protein